MSDNCETLADIVAEMRKRMKSYYYSREGRNLMRQYADRIEAVARRETAAAWIEGYNYAKRDPNAVKTGDMLLAENERMRKALADTAENLRIHLQIPTQTVSMNRREVEAMARDCEKALGED